MWGVACASRLSGGLRSILSVDSPIWHNAASKPSVHFLALNRMSTVSKFATSRNQIAGIAVTELAEKFGTPVYVYDQQVIDRRIADLADFDVVRYAQKACGNLAVLDRMRKQGVVVDAVSAGEIRRAMAAGYSADPGKHDIVYTADIFDREALAVAREVGVVGVKGVASDDVAAGGAVGGVRRPSVAPGSATGSRNC